MILHQRKQGSQQRKAGRTIHFLPNWAGQGGMKELVLVIEGERDEYLTIEFESEEEVRVLLSQAHIVFQNYRRRHL